MISTEYSVSSQARRMSSDHDHGFSMASNYNSRPRPAEVMVEGDEVHLIRERESYEDLVRGERVP